MTLPERIWATDTSSRGGDWWYAEDLEMFAIDPGRYREYVRLDTVYTKEQVGPLLDALRELIDLQDSALSLKPRAQGINAPEDATIRRLCEQVGYGAVMDSAARSWFLKCPVSCHTTYHCYSVVEMETEKAKAALDNFNNRTSEEK